MKNKTAVLRDKVKYVPAGLEAWPSRMGQIFVKLEHNKSNSIKRGSGFKVIRLPDRTLYVVYESSKAVRFIDKQLDCDYMVPYQNPIELQNRTDLVLVNPTHAKGGFSNIFRPLDINVISDSGGFQMRSGVSDFISPDDIIAFYNKHTDIGMSLDLPLIHGYEHLFWDPISKLMKRNDDYMLERLNKNVELAMVIHGADVKLRERRLKILKRPAKVVAIGGLQQFDPTKQPEKFNTSLNNALYVIMNTKDHAEYYHFLGITSRIWIAVFAYLVGTGLVKSCGGDSVSHRMASITGNYKHSFLESSMTDTQKYYLNALHYDHKTTHDPAPVKIKKFDHTRINTSCCCPICQAIGDLNILAEFQFCESHLIWFSQQEKDLICDNVQFYIDGKLTINQLAKQCVPGGQTHTLKQLFHMIDETIDKGFKPYEEKSTLQGMLLTSTEKSYHNDPAVIERYKRIISNYEKFHNKKFL